MLPSSTWLFQVLFDFQFNIDLQPQTPTVFMTVLHPHPMPKPKHTLYTIANTSVVSFKSNISIKSFSLFLCLKCTPQVLLLWISLSYTKCTSHFLLGNILHYHITLPTLCDTCKKSNIALKKTFPYNKLSHSLKPANLNLAIVVTAN